MSRYSTRSSTEAFASVSMSVMPCSASVAVVAGFLPALADGERELVFVDDDLHLPALDVGDANLIHFGGRQGVRGEDRRLVRPLDDVYLLAAQLADDGLHARTLH